MRWLGFESIKYNNRQWKNEEGKKPMPDKLDNGPVSESDW